jgi:RNA polymerase sigma-70 factor, ECF subfamily
VVTISTLETVIESHRAELARYCRRMLRSDADAEDAVQETLLRAWCSAGQLREPASARSWLYRIAGNVCVDLMKRRARRPIPTDECPEPTEGAAELDPEGLLLAREDLRLALYAAVYRLPPRQRAVFLLREILCWRAAEIAEFLDMSVPAVNSALQRAHATLSRHDRESLVATEDDSRHRVVARYLSAFAADDVDAFAPLSCAA